MFFFSATFRAYWSWSPKLCFLKCSRFTLNEKKCMLYSLYYAEVCYESPLHCARATQLLLKKCCSNNELLARLCSIWPARDSNLKPQLQRQTRNRSRIWGSYFVMSLWTIQLVLLSCSGNNLTLKIVYQPFLRKLIDFWIFFTLKFLNINI